VTWTAICRPVGESRVPETVDIVKIDLRTKGGRIKNLVRVIRLCSLVVPITTMIGSHTTSENIAVKS
jgi:hypothetical protein